MIGRLEFCSCSIFSLTGTWQARRAPQSCFQAARHDNSTRVFNNCPTFRPLASKLHLAEPFSQSTCLAISACILWHVQHQNIICSTKQWLHKVLAPSSINCDDLNYQCLHSLSMLVPRLVATILYVTCRHSKINKIPSRLGRSIPFSYRRYVYFS